MVNYLRVLFLDFELKSGSLMVSFLLKNHQKELNGPELEISCGLWFLCAAARLFLFDNTFSLAHSSTHTQMDGWELSE